VTVTDKLYSALGPAARVAAVVAAMARRDDPETTRLMQTAPLATYKAHDLEFWQMLHCAERLALHAALLIEPEVVRYVVHLGTLVHLTSGEGCDPEAFERMTEGIKEITASIKAYWLAYTETCADIGIDPDELLRGVGAELSSNARLLTAKDVEPDPELLASATDLMRQLSGR
jgi:hypothetical protein